MNFTSGILADFGNVLVPTSWLPVFLKINRAAKRFFKDRE